LYSFVGISSIIHSPLHSVRRHERVSTNITSVAQIKANEFVVVIVVVVAAAAAVVIVI